MITQHSLNCPICNQALDKIASFPNNRDVYVCKKCGLRRLLPLPSKQNLTNLYGRKKYYTEELFELHDDLKIDYDWKNPIIKLYQKHLNEILLTAPPPKHLLEIGCARGVFLDMARSAGYKVQGIEANPYASKYAHKFFNLQVTTTKFESVKKNFGKFDIIVAYDVIEHVPNPSGFIKKITTFLKPGGLVVIGTPNSSSLLYKIAEKTALVSKSRIVYPLIRFYGRGVEHLSIFNPENLKRLLTLNKFRVIKLYGYSIPLKNMVRVNGIYRIALTLLARPSYEFVTIARKTKNTKAKKV